MNFVGFNNFKIISVTTYAQLVVFGVWLDIERLPCFEMCLIPVHNEPDLPIKNGKG